MNRNNQRAQIETLAVQLGMSLESLPPDNLAALALIQSFIAITSRLSIPRKKGL